MSDKSLTSAHQEQILKRVSKSFGIEKRFNLKNWCENKLVEIGAIQLLNSCAFDI